MVKSLKTPKTPTLRNSRTGQGANQLLFRYILKKLLSDINWACLESFDSYLYLLSNLKIENFHHISLPMYIDMYQNCYFILNHFTVYFSKRF